MEMYLWFSDPSETIIIVSPYHEGVTLETFVTKYL